MLYYDFLGKRKNTFKKTWDLIKDKDDIVIVELGTTRSFRGGGKSSDINDWFPNNPEKWAWSDGVFTKLFADNLDKLNKKYTLYTIDPCPTAMDVVKVMCSKNKNVKPIMNTSTQFLKMLNCKIDLLYCDHLESSEEACLKHLQDAKIVIENDLMKDDGIILIDDCDKNNNGKGKYSIPYLLNNNYKSIIYEYQNVLVRDS